MRRVHPLKEHPPAILISPGTEEQGAEFSDRSLSLSEAYPRAVADAGGIPLVLPCGSSRALISECVRRADGVLLTGGEDIEPKLYRDRLPPRLRRTVKSTADGGARDFRELVLIDEVFQQGKPMLAICRGHQLVNVALGGDLIVDIPTEMPQASRHCRMDRRSDVVHEVRLTPGSLLSKIVSANRLGVNSTHHQAVGKVADPLQVSAVSEDGIVEGMELKSESVHLLPFLLTVQFHPERLARQYWEHRALFQAFTDACIRHRNNKL